MEPLDGYLQLQQFPELRDGELLAAVRAPVFAHVDRFRRDQGRLPSKYVGYGADIWGLTACDGPGAGTYGKWAYHARGASAAGIADDGTIAPTAAGGSFPFTPTESYAALKAMKSYKNGALYTDYGFLDSFNPSEDWIDGWWLGIDQGPILVMLENYRTQLIWKLMKKNAYIVNGLKGAGFTGGWLN